MSARTIVVGGGLSGLTAAWRLARSGEDVLLVEASDRPGGVVKTERRDGFLLETGPNTVRSAPELWRLIEELGLMGEALVADPRSPRYVDFAGRLQALPMSPGALLATRLLSLAGKARLLTEPLRARGPNGKESVRDFFARRLGPEVADRLVEPFVAGVYAGSAARLGMAEAFPTLARWERVHGSLFAGALAARKGRGAAREDLISFREGLETLPRALARALGAAFRPRTPVEAVEPDGGGWRIRTPAGALSADRVILAAPAYRIAPLFSAVEPEASRALSEIPHPPLAVLHLSWPEAALARPLYGFGHLIVPSRERRILGAVWSSSLWPGRAPAGQTLFTVFLGGSRDPDAAALSDEELVAAGARDLEGAGLLRGRPRCLLITRLPHAIPQYEPGHGDRIAALARTEERRPGLRFLGSYRDGVSVAEVVRAALTVGSPPGRVAPDI